MGMREMSALGQRLADRNSIINRAMLAVGTFDRAIDPSAEKISSIRS